LATQSSEFLIAWHRSGDWIPSEQLSRNQAQVGART
jgi:hypothetical protein